MTLNLNPWAVIQSGYTKNLPRSNKEYLHKNLPDGVQDFVQIRIILHPVWIFFNQQIQFSGIGRVQPALHTHPAGIDRESE